MNSKPDTVDVTPTPRVLRMLGQIEFAPWQCLAELIDNSIDALLDSNPSGGGSDQKPAIDIDLPSIAGFSEESQICVRDNGSGMSFDELTNAVRAGYSGNGPVDKLGLFGMGFNIATARLGNCTQIWTTKAGHQDWTGIQVKFDEMEQSGTYAVPRLTRPKTEAEIRSQVQGTEIRISYLELDRVRRLNWGTGKSNTRERLGKLYGRVISQNGIQLNYDGEVVHPRRHCVWDKKRAVETKAHGIIHAQEDVEFTLSPRRYCTTCWVWLLEDDNVCPACGFTSNLVERPRKIVGWLGVQRYFDKDHFGIDLIRNGRVIEQLDKSLFNWTDPTTDEEEREYPIDAVYLGGRIVGELEIDFVRVSHQKNAFDKLDPQWKEVVKCIRGEAPLRPHIARRRNYSPNTSPMARMFSGYRAGYGGLKCLVAGNRGNKARDDREFREWTERFHRGDPEYQDDSKWYELAELAELPEFETDDSDQDEDDFPIGETEDLNDGTEDGSVTDDDSQTGDVPLIEYTADDELSGTYSLPDLPGSPSIVVEARRFASAEVTLPMMFSGQSSVATFDYDPSHPLFRHDLELPAECLVRSLAHQFLYLAAASQDKHPIILVERDLRQRYFPQNVVTLESSQSRGHDVLDGLRRHLIEVLNESDAIDPSSLDDAELNLIRSGMLASALGDEGEFQRAFRTGEFIQYVSSEFLGDSALRWPHAILDGEYFSVPYVNLSAKHRHQAVAMITDALRDAVWLLSDVGVGALNKDYQWRLRIRRAESSIRLLELWHC